MNLREGKEGRPVQQQNALRAGQIQQLDSLSASQLFVKGAQKGIEGAENVAESTKELAETVKDAVTK